MMLRARLSQREAFARIGGLCVLDAKLPEKLFDCLALEDIPHRQSDALL